MLDMFGFDIIPNTQRFFQKNGQTYTNTYAQSEWTLSSVTSILSGKYTNEHLIFNEHKEDYVFDENLPETLVKDGFLTFACSNNPKISPTYGFDKGFDRFVSALDENVSYIIDQAQEQLNAFGGKQYLFLAFFDLHEAHTLQPISSQVSNNIEDFIYRPLVGNSKDTSMLYDAERIQMYKNSITYFDRQIKRLYEIINSYDEQAVVTLHSDHGVNFICKTNELLSKEREKVIFFYKNGKDSSQEVIKEIREVKNIPAMICNDLKIMHSFPLVNNGVAITESLFLIKTMKLQLEITLMSFFIKFHGKMLLIVI